MSWLLTGSILLVYCAQLLGVRHGYDVLGTDLAVRPRLVAEHRYGTLLSYAWAHALPLPSLPRYAGFHLASNLVPLFCLAPALERLLGPWRLLALFCGGAIAAALAWLSWSPRPGHAMIGASGALFALVTAGAVMNLRRWSADLVFLQLRFHLRLRMGAIVLCAIEAAQLAWPGLPNVAHVAHLGGALFGLVFSYLIAPPRVENFSM